ncbi:MAG: hypothetical protein KDA61_17075, partial [Planctomycetales bacterium]|nr:hypothetical protein [Planctomycetales bacterium]
PAFVHVQMRPQFPEDLTHVEASHCSPMGWILSRWDREGATTRWEVSLPPGVTADAYLPARQIGSVKESGVPLADSRGISIQGQAEGRLHVRLQSGSYQFEIR